MPDAFVSPFDFPTSHEVVGYGRARHNLGRPAEVEVEIFLAAVPARRASTPPPDVVVRWIGCGQFDLVPIGSVWREGARVGQRSGLEKIAGRVGFAGRGTLDAFGASPADASPMSMECFRLKLNLEKPGPSAVWVPVAEVMRVLFGVSSHFLVQMCGGIRTPDLARDSAFFDRQASGWVDDDTFKITCTRNPTNLEAVTIAAMLAQPAHRQAHDSIFKEMEKACRKTPEGGSLKMLFPFKDSESAWTFEGRRIPLRKGGTVWVPPPTAEAPDVSGAQTATAFLVTRILHMAFPLPFSCVQIAIERPRVKEGLPPPEGRTVRRPTRRVRLQSRRPAGSGGAPIQVQSEEAVIESTRPVEVIRLPREDVRGKSRFVIFDPVDERLGSTADRQPGGDGEVAHVVISRGKAPALLLEEAEDQTPASRAATFDCIVALAHDRGWTVVYGDLGDDGLPRCETVGSMSLLVMAVRRSSGMLYVADAGTSRDDGRSLGLLMPEDAAMGVADAVGRIREAAAGNGARWLGRSNVPGFRIKGLARLPPEVWKKDFARYRELVVAAIDGFG